MTDYEKLFGTPERAAKTMQRITCDSYNCEKCPFEPVCDLPRTQIIEWLKGESDD